MRHKKEKEIVDEPILPTRKALSLETIQIYLKHREAGVVELAETLNLIYSHPEARCYLSLAKFVNKMLQEIEEYSTGKILTTDKDDKIFERINLFMKALPDYNKTFADGKKVIDKMGITGGEAAEEFSSTDYFEGLSKD